MTDSNTSKTDSGRRLWATHDCPKCRGHGWLQMRNDEIECPYCIRGQIEDEDEDRCEPEWAAPSIERAA